MSAAIIINHVPCLQGKRDFHRESRCDFIFLAKREEEESSSGELVNSGKISFLLAKKA